MFTKTVHAQCHRFNAYNSQNRFLASRPFEEVQCDKAKSYFYHDAFPFASSINDNEEQDKKKLVSKNNNHRRGKTVSFSNLEIRDYSIVIGDHPFCDKLPLSLGWSHSPQSTVVPIDTYEDCRGPRKDRSNLRMTYFERKNVLKRISGLTEKDIIRQERRCKSALDLKSLQRFNS